MGHKRGATYKANCVSKPDNFIVDRQTKDMGEESEY